MIKKLVLGVLALALVMGVAGASSQPYWIDSEVSNVYFTGDIPASSTVDYYVINEAGYSPTVLEYSLDFDGTNDYATVPHSSEFSLTDYYKIRAIVKIDSGVGSGHWTAFASKGSGTVGDGGGEDHNFCLGIENNLFTASQNIILLFEESNGANHDVTYALSNLNFGEWYLIEGEWDTNTNELILYVNGVEVSKTTGVSGTPNANTQDITIGLPVISASNMEYFDGEIAEIEILSSTGTVAKYEINEGTGTTLTDETGNHGGSISGATWGEAPPFDPASTSIVVTDMGAHYKVSVTNNEASELVDYPVTVSCGVLGVSSTIQSLHITTEDPADPIPTPAVVLDYAIDEDLSDVWIKGDWDAGLTTMYAVKTSGYSSDPGNTFELYDGGESGAPADRWTFVSGTGTIEYSSVVSKYGSKSILVDGTDKPYFASIQAMPDDVVVECYVRWEGSDQNGFVCARASSATPTFYAVRNMKGATNLYRALSDTYVLLDSGTTGDVGTTAWQKYTFRAFGSDLKWYLDDDLVCSATDSNIGSGGIGFRGGTTTTGIYVDDVKVRKVAATEPTTQVIDMGEYYIIQVDSDEALNDYQVAIPCDNLNIAHTTESILFTDTNPLVQDNPTPDPEPEYNPTSGGRYSQYIDMIFPYDGEFSAWAMIGNVISVWTFHVGDDIFWLFVLPLPILAYWIKTKSVELPTIVYLVLGGMFYGLAPDVMQTPARIMLMFGIAGMMYHFFKNRG